MENNIESIVGMNKGNGGYHSRIDDSGYDKDGFDDVGMVNPNIQNPNIKRPRRINTYIPKPVSFEKTPKYSINEIVPDTQKFVDGKYMMVKIGVDGDHKISVGYSGVPASERDGVIYAIQDVFGINQNQTKDETVGKPKITYNKCGKIEAVVVTKYKNTDYVGRATVNNEGGNSVLYAVAQAYLDTIKQRKIIHK